MTETCECPADGCNYSGVKQSVAAHHSGKRDDAHSGGYEYAMTRIEDNQQDGTDGSEPDETDTTSDGEVFDNFPEAEEPDEPQREAIPLECGCGDAITPEMQEKHDPPVTVRCEVCGKVWKVTSYE